MNSDTDNQTDSNTEARRRLLKAASAAPLVATLSPNSALALSSAAACAGGKFSNKKFEKNGNSINGDTAVRYGVPYFQKKRGNNPTGWANKLYLIDGEYYGQNGNTYPARERGLNRYYNSDTAHVLALFDVSNGDANFVGLWPKVQLEDTYATPMTGSCWTSLSSGKSYTPN